MQSLHQKLESALKALVDAGGFGVTVFCGLSADEKTSPRLIVNAGNGTEFPQNSGNFTISVVCELSTNANSTGIDEHRALCEQVFGVLMEDDLAVQLSNQAADFHVFGISNRASRDNVDDGAWVSELTMDAYCAGTDF